MAPQGRTHVSSPHLPEDGTTVWEHPLDLWLTTHSIQRWPSILIKVYHRSVWIGRDEFVAYGLVSLPTAPGLHHISCPTWQACEARRTFGQAMQGELVKQYVEVRVLLGVYEKGLIIMCPPLEHTWDTGAIMLWPWDSETTGMSAMATSRCGNLQRNMQRVHTASFHPNAARHRLCPCAGRSHTSCSSMSRASR